jgi:hypothetical protein
MDLRAYVGCLLAWGFVAVAVSLAEGHEQLVASFARFCLNYLDLLIPQYIFLRLLLINYVRNEIQTSSKAGDALRARHVPFVSRE